MGTQNLRGGIADIGKRDTVIVGQVHHLLAHAAGIEHARQRAAVDPTPGTEQHRGDYHLIDIAAQDGRMTPAQRDESIVIPDDGTRVAHRQLRRFLGSPERRDHHRNRTGPRLFQRGDKCRRVAHGLEKNGDYARGLLLQQVVHVIADRRIGFLRAGNHVVKGEARVIVGQVSHARPRMQDQANMSGRSSGRRAIETDQHVIVVIVKSHRIATTDRDTSLGGFHAQTLG